MWGPIAEGLDLPAGINRVDFPLVDVVGPESQVGADGETVERPATQPALFREEITGDGAR